MTQAPERQRRDFAGIEDVTAALRDAGHRVSSAMRIVLEALFAAEAPVSAADIAGGLDGRVPPLDLSSVYRNLERLQDIGVVTHVHVSHGAGLYALARGPEHEYLVCERCGKVTALKPEALDEVRGLVRALSGFAARFDHFPIHGLCPECARLASGPSRNVPPEIGGRRSPPGGVLDP